jgi:hypothetical protein
MRSPPSGASKSREFCAPPGQYVTGMFGWQDYAVVDAAAIEREVGGSGLPISTSLGVLGPNGLTAYSPPEIRQPGGRDRGRVHGGSDGHVGQIAKIKGAELWHCAADKVRMCREQFRFDSAVDYRADDFEAALDAAPRHRCLFRQHGSVHQRFRHATSRRRSTGRHLRHGVHRELGSATPGPRVDVIFVKRPNAGISHL